MRRLTLSGVAAFALLVGYSDQARAAPSAAGPTASTVRRYVTAMAPHIKAYKTLLARADTAFDEEISHTVAIQRMNRSRNDFRRLANRVAAERAPAGLGARHRNLVTAIRTVSTAFSKFAAARRQYARDGNQAALLARNTAARQPLPRAEKLQFGWGAAVRSTARRLGVPIPAWLRDFAP